jgi:hypothetical protein
MEPYETATSHLLLLQELSFSPFQTANISSKTDDRPAELMLCQFSKPHDEEQPSPGISSEALTCVITSHLEPVTPAGVALCS